MSYRDAVVVVTGASSGIGRALAEAFAQRGSTLVAVARREAELASLVEACRMHAPASRYRAGDLGDRAFAEEVVEETLAREGRIDVLVNNAGMPLHAHLSTTTPEQVARVMDVNFMSCVWCTLAALPGMVAEGTGHVVNVSSFGALVVPPREPVYAASKAAMEAFSQGLWNELSGSGVGVLLVRPGAIDTEIWDKQQEPNRYGGAKAPVCAVVEAVFQGLERGWHEVTVPRRDPRLWAARWLRALAPSLLRRGVARVDPVRPEQLARFRARAAAGTRASARVSADPERTPPDPCHIPALRLRCAACKWASPC